MNNNKNKVGSIYYDKRDKKWKCSYYILDKELLIEKRRVKSFATEKEAKEFLITIQCQKGNELYVKNNGIPLNQLLRAIAEKKLESNIIKERTIFKNNLFYS